ncbi:MAG: alpha-E domain-containing protein [Pseudomonadota bacterium]
MLSRVAENLYWFGRYLQRAENTARLVMVNGNLLMDLPKSVTFGWQPLVEILGAEETYTELYPDFSENNVVRFLLLDEKNPSSVLSSLHLAREILRTTRDAMPREAWEKLNELYWAVEERGERSVARARRPEFLNRIVEGALLTYGILLSNLSRDIGFQFLRIGTNIEQADMTTRIIDVRSTELTRRGKTADEFEDLQWASVLRSLTAFQMFRRHGGGRLAGTAVLRYLLQDREFPRSVVFCLSMIQEALRQLPDARKFERELDRARALVRDAGVKSLLESEDGLHKLLDEIQVSLARMHDALAESYFRV